MQHLDKYFLVALSDGQFKRIQTDLNMEKDIEITCRIEYEKKVASIISSCTNHLFLYNTIVCTLTICKYIFCCERKIQSSEPEKQDTKRN
jgi:SUMO ligase MMS21 Smc5/6 complex component